MSLEREAVQAAAQEYAEEQAIKDSVTDFADAEQSPEGAPFTMDFGFLLSKTGEGSVESYIDHPLNFKHSKGLAQVLRGATGMLGALDLAIVDIGLGALQMFKEGSAAHAAQ